MPILGIDDTDSRTRGMCTTWIATEVTRRLRSGSVDEIALVRLCPSIEHKTRGNGAIAISATGDRDELLDVGRAVVDRWAAHEDAATNPGIVIIDDTPPGSADLVAFAREAIRREQSASVAETVREHSDGDAHAWGNGRGLIGATAAVGALVGHRGADPGDPVFGDWSYEWIGYRTEDRWGTSREIAPSLATHRRCAEVDVWDTFDPAIGEPVCIPRSPCPVSFGIRGEHPSAVRSVADTFTGEPIDRAQLFVTNQGTDGHIVDAGTVPLEDGRSYRAGGIVVGAADTRRGGHVSVPLAIDGETIDGLAFAPTGAFRDAVRALHPGDRVIVCGELDDGALKLEKFALQERTLTDRVVPVCPSCDRSMKSAGAEQGYRCRSCGTATDGRLPVTAERTIRSGWYFVPPRARRHLSRPPDRTRSLLPLHQI